MHVTKRKPLADAASRGNIDIIPQRTHKDLDLVNATALPHHDSLCTNAPFAVRNIASSSSDRNAHNNKPHNSSPASKNDGVNSKSKRNSQASTNSTNASERGRRRKTHIGPWQLGRDLGKGGCGKVRKVRHAVTGQEAACKIINKKVADTARAESLINLVEKSRRSNPGVLAQGANVMPFGIEREVVIMKLLDHPNIVKLFDVWENRNELYLVMEHVDGGELFDYIEQNERLEEDEALWVFRQVVVALLYCHRLGIHHRDLKPENILLDTREGFLRVKLVDFGMAALQPPGRFLSTPCGSIYYAAPEVFDKCYDGSKVDVWSLGVILYVMLTGTTPYIFDAEKMHDNVQLWVKLIKSGTYTIPIQLGLQARDMIRRMLVPDPKLRISLQEVWNHPFVHSHGSEWGEGIEYRNIEKWIGTGMNIENWKFKSRSGIDREILRNLSTLWHSEREEVLVQRLLSAELNLEKYFYAALVRHREEQLENYTGSSDGITYSASDYQHTRSRSEVVSLPPLPPNAFTRSRSQYSILGEAHLRSRGASLEPPPSSGSYDPFRASSISIAAARRSYASVTTNTANPAPSRSQSAARSQRQPGTSRLEALRKQRRTSIASSTASSRRGSISALSTPARGRKLSRTSLLTALPSSPPVAPTIIKARLHHKRGVSFSNLHRNSGVAMPTGSSVYELSGGDAPPGARTSSVVIAKVEAKNEPVVRSRKEGLRQYDPATLQVQKRLRQSQSIEEEARKVSTELEKYCEEAFKWSSDSSSKRTSASTTLGPHYTPNSSFSKHGSGSLADLTSGDKAKQDLRPLRVEEGGGRPPETPNTYIARELAETRKRLAARSKQDQGAQGAPYQEVLAHLDALLEPGVAKLSVNYDHRRIISAPDSRSATTTMYLPPISEDAVVELSVKQSEDFGKPPMKANLNTTRGLAASRISGKPQNTIRVIEPTSPTAPVVAPLTIRKANDSGSTESSTSQIRLSRPLLSSVKSATDVRKESWTTMNTTSDRSTKGDGKEKRSGSGSLSAKKWFSRKLLNGDGAPAGTRLPADSEHGLGRDMSSRGQGSHEHNGPCTTEDNDTPRPTKQSKRPKLFGFMRKREDGSKPSGRMTVGAVQDDTLSINSIVGSSNITTRREEYSKPRTEHDPDYLGVQRNWLARFLNIKPVSRTLCFQRGRGAVRQELVRLLRSWRVYGIRDIVYDRQRSLIFASLGSTNHLGIREIAFVIELFVVLDNGRRAHLCLARVTQRKGAASSFRRVVDEMERVLAGSGILVGDEGMAAEMGELLGGGA